MRFSSRSIEKILSQSHDQKYFQLLSLFDFQRILKREQYLPSKKKPHKGFGGAKACYYFDVDIFGTPSRISVREGTDGKFMIYTLAEKTKKESERFETAHRIAIRGRNKNTHCSFALNTEQVGIPNIPRFLSGMQI